MSNNYSRLTGLFLVLVVLFGVPTWSVGAAIPITNENIDNYPVWTNHSAGDDYVITEDLDLGNGQSFEIQVGTSVNFFYEATNHSLTAEGNEFAFEADQCEIRNAAFLSFDGCEKVDINIVNFVECGESGVTLIFANAPDDIYEITGATFTDMEGDVIIEIRDGCSNFIIEQCIFEDAGVLSSIVIHSDGGDSPWDIEIFDNEFTCANQTSGIKVNDVDFVSAISNIRIYNNIFTCTGDSDAVNILSDVPAGTTIIRNNVFDGDGGARAIEVDCDDNANTHEHPFNYNNRIIGTFDVGIYVEVEDNGDFESADMIGPIIMNNHCEVTGGTGYKLLAINAATGDFYCTGDIRFLFNVANGCDIIINNQKVDLKSEMVDIENLNPYK